MIFNGKLVCYDFRISVIGFIVEFLKHIELSIVVLQNLLQTSAKHWQKGAKQMPNMSKQNPETFPNNVNRSQRNDD